MWALVSVSVLLWTWAIDVFCLEPREGEELVPVGGLSSLGHRVALALGLSNVPH